MQTFFKKASGLPQYINMLEDLQKQALRMDRNDPITDQTILGLAEADILANAQYPRLEEDWSRVPAANKNWQEWTRLALLEYERVETRLAAQGGANSFGGAPQQAAAAATMPIAGRTRSAVQPVAHRTRANDEPEEPPMLGGDGLSPDAMAEIEAALDNFACAARSDQDSLAELVRSNAALVRTNEKLVAKAAKAGGAGAQSARPASENGKINKPTCPDPVGSG